MSDDLFNRIDEYLTESKNDLISHIDSLSDDIRDELLRIRKRSRLISATGFKPDVETFDLKDIKDRFKKSTEKMVALIDRLQNKL